MTANATAQETKEMEEEAKQLAAAVVEQVMSGQYEGADTSDVAIEEAAVKEEPANTVVTQPAPVTQNTEQEQSGETYSDKTQSEDKAELEEQTTTAEISQPVELILPIGFTSTMKTAMQVYWFYHISLDAPFSNAS